MPTSCRGRWPARAAAPRCATSPSTTTAPEHGRLRRAAHAARHGAGDHRSLERARHRGAGARLRRQGAGGPASSPSSTARRPWRTAPVDVRALGCDFYAFSGHKMYGPTGIGVLYGTLRRARRAAAVAGRRRHDRDRHLAGARPTPAAARLEAGTPNIGGAVGLGAAVRLPANRRHRERDRARTRRELLRLLAARARRGSLDCASSAPARRRSASSRSSSTACMRTTSARCSISSGIAVRIGHHCAMPVMQRFGVPATVRASLSLHNTARRHRRAGRRAAVARERLGMNHRSTICTRTCCSSTSASRATRPAAMRPPRRRRPQPAVRRHGVAAAGRSATASSPRSPSRARAARSASPRLR